MSSLISPFELKQLRKTIGANLARMGQLLGLYEPNSPSFVKSMENGSEPIPGPVQRLAKYMQEGIAEGAMHEFMPRYLICSGMDDPDSRQEWLLHTRYPRFLAALTDNPISGVVSETVDNVEWVSVALWIDEPVDDGVQAVIDGAKFLAGYTETVLKED